MTLFMLATAAALMMTAASAGHVRDDSTPEAIEVEVVVDATRAEVYQAWTTTEGVLTFFSNQAYVELRLGGAYEIFFDTSAPAGRRGSEGCTVLGWVPEEMLCFTWNAPPDFKDLRAERTFVVVRFDDAGGGATRVRLRHAGFGDGDDWHGVRAYFANAWPSVLANLKKRFDEGPLFGTVKPAPRTEMKTYVYYLNPARPNFFDTGPTDFESQMIEKHAEYLRKLLGEGTLILAGPSSDPTIEPTAVDSIPLGMAPPGIVIYEAANDVAAKKIMEFDPTVRFGVFKAQANPIRIVMERR